MIERWRGYFNAVSACQWTSVGGVLLTALICCCILWPDSSEPVVTMQNGTPTSPSMEITGLSAAAAKTSLRNPFSAAHERRGEVSLPEAPAEIKAKAQPASPSVAAAQTISASMGTPHVPPPASIVLRGVVTGADGTRIAILARGDEGAALRLGETWQGHTLRVLTDTTALLDSAAGTMTLTRE